MGLGLGLGLGLGMRGKGAKAVQPLLLDEFSGAVVAYSLRKLSNDYSGSAIRVRRSSDNTELDIGFNGVELDTASLLSFVGAGNGFVTTWYDQSGNASDATQATASRQPKIVSSGVLEKMSGKVSVLFDRANNQALQGALDQSYAQLNTIFIVKKLNTTGIDHRFFDGNDDSNRHTVYTTVGEYRLFAGSVYSSGVMESSNPTLICVLFNTTSSRLSKNGAALSTAGNAGSQSIDGVTIGADRSGLSNNLDGYMSEVILYPTNQTTSKSNIETNINNYYSIY